MKPYAVVVLLVLAVLAGCGADHRTDLTVTPGLADQAGTVASVAKVRLRSAGISASVAESGGDVRVRVAAKDADRARILLQPGGVTFRETWTDPSGDVTNPAMNAPKAPYQLAADRACVGGLTATAAPAACTLETLADLDCTTTTPVVDPEPNHFVVACDRTRQAKYLLKPAALTAADLQSAVATIGTTSTGASTGAWEVDVTFRDSSVAKVQAVSQRLVENDMQPLAITLGGVVVSNPNTHGVLGANIVISGGSPPFSEQQAGDLAAVLRSPAMPLSTIR